MPCGRGLGQSNACAPWGSRPEDAGAVELDDEAGEEGDQDKGDKIPGRMDRPICFDETRPAEELLVPAKAPKKAQEQPTPLTGFL